MQRLVHVAGEVKDPTQRNGAARTHASALRLRAKAGARIAYLLNRAFAN